jgi:hypothetical protein
MQVDEETNGTLSVQRVVLCARQRHEMQNRLSFFSFCDKSSFGCGGISFSCCNTSNLLRMFIDRSGPSLSPFPRTHRDSDPRVSSICSLLESDSLIADFGLPYFL